MGISSAPSIQDIDNAIDIANRYPLAQEKIERKKISHSPDGMTLTEIGRELGVSHQRVEQIINGALKKLRRRNDL